MPRIEQNLSFIWVGNPMPEQYRHNILQWMRQNPDYEVHIWTESHMRETMIQQFIESYKAHPSGDPNAKHYIDPSNPFTYWLQFIKEEIHGTASYATVTNSLFFDSIGTLEPISSAVIMGEELEAWKNYGAVSDILRIWVLHHIGGIYMDTDTFPVERPIPTGITLPKPIAFGMEPTVPGLNCPNNHIIAAPRGHPKLRSLAEFLDEAYHGSFEELRTSTVEASGSGIWYLSEREKSAYARVLRAHQILRQQRTHQNAQEQHQAGIDLQRILWMRTLSRTGPNRIRMWIQRNDPAYAPVDRSTMADLHIHFDDIHANSQLLHDWVFERVTQYYPRVEAHNSWLSFKNAQEPEFDHTGYIRGLLQHLVENAMDISEFPPMKSVPFEPNVDQFRKRPTSSSERGTSEDDLPTIDTASMFLFS